MYNITQEQFNAKVRKMAYSLGQLMDRVPTDETIERCKAELMNSGKIRIVESRDKIALEA